MRTYAIGDIHGCLHTLKDLLHKLRLGPDDRVIFLGDYIDRGPFSKQVIDFLKTIVDSKQYIALMGNHERMCVDSYDGSGYWGQVWMQNGGIETIDSYDERTEAQKRRPAFEDYEAEEVWRANLPKVSKEHLNWMRQLPVKYETEKFFFCHAGVDPEVELDDQTPDDLLWIRGEFLKSKKNFGKIVVFGHTPLEDVTIKDNYIGVDTGCTYGHKLSAICLETMTVYHATHNDKDEL